MCSAISKKRATTSIPFDGYVGGGLHIMLFWNEVYQMGCVSLPRRFLEQCGNSWIILHSFKNQTSKLPITCMPDFKPEDSLKLISSKI